MFVHAVYFWLRPELNEEQRATFIAGVNSLATVGTVQHSFIGVPASTDRPVIDRSYSYAAVLVFENKQGHDDYQVDPIHLNFVEECGTFWSKVLIYDSVSP
jgi:hypothetical protein